MPEDFDIEIHCPHCDTARVVKLSQIARKETITCRGCEQDIHMQPDPPHGSAEEQQQNDPLAFIKQAVEKIKPED